MNIKWTYSESSVVPQEVDTESSPNTVYLRKDVKAVERADINNKETMTMYEYLEATLTPIEYQAYIAERQRADIDYIAMMSGIDLEED